MFNFLKVKKESKGATEETLAKLRSLLFPPLVLEQQLHPETGKLFKFYVDSSVDTNLYAALCDLEEVCGDDATFRTIKGIIEKLAAARRLLEDDMEFDPEAKYMVLDSIDEA